MSFLEDVKEIHPTITAEINGSIRAMIKHTIPPLRNILEFKELYEKCFSQCKKYLKLLKLF